MLCSRAEEEEEQQHKKEDEKNECRTKNDECKK